MKVCGSHLIFPPNYPKYYSLKCNRTQEQRRVSELICADVNSLRRKDSAPITMQVEKRGLRLSGGFAFVGDKINEKYLFSAYLVPTNYATS